MAARKPTRQTISFGQEVTRLRNEAGLSRLDLAKGAAVSRSYIAQVENGTTRCRRDFATRLDQALGTDTMLTDAWDDIVKSSAYPKFFTDYPMPRPQQHFYARTTKHSYTAFFKPRSTRGHCYGRTAHSKDV